MKSMKERTQRFVWTTKVGEKGQIVIPKEAREVFNIKAGDTLLLLGDTERGIAIAKAEDYLKIFVLDNLNFAINFYDSVLDGYYKRLKELSV